MDSDMDADTDMDEWSPFMIEKPEHFDMDTDSGAATEAYGVLTYKRWNFDKSQIIWITEHHQWVEIFS